MVDPPTGPSWSMISWKTVVGTLLTLVTGVLGFLGAALSIKSKTHEIDANTDIAMRKSDLDERSRLDTITNVRMKQLTDDIAALRDELRDQDRQLREKNRDALVGWNLARFWNGKAHELNHALNNAKPLLVEWGGQLGKTIRADWQVPSVLPPFDDVAGVVSNRPIDEG